MTQRSGSLIVLLALIAAMIVWPLGCSLPANPWRFSDPPSRSTSARAHSATQHAPLIVVVGRFDDPSRAPNYSRGVGRAMSDAFSRTLMHAGTHEVRINESLAAEARRFARFDAPAAASTATSTPQSRRTSSSASANLASEQAQARERLDRYRADVDYVVIGKVTDFYHTGDLPDEASRRGFIGRRNEAIVSLDLRIVDMHTMQVVGTDHLMGTANARRTRSHELYENVALDSYLFWNTPLGRAGRRAIDRAVSRAVALMPADRAGRDTMLAQQENAEHPDADMERAEASLDEAEATEPVNLAVRGEAADASIAPTQPAKPARAATPRFANVRPQILRTNDSRRVTIMGGRNIGVEHGDRFHILREVGPASPQTLVNDPVTGRPLRIAIIDLDETTSTGWLLGQKPRQLDLRGMLLDLPGAASPAGSPAPNPTAPATASVEPTSADHAGP